ncbi:GntR family transcriptional regulator [Streptomyces sp. DG2A-72]|uniref:GntR family transcriptional regulator n=1 Tax=Streptomyces sp. DG2A-72 TaxID=3051386 RepID=UPI0034647DFE
MRPGATKWDAQFRACCQCLLADHPPAGDDRCTARPGAGVVCERPRHTHRSLPLLLRNRLPPRNPTGSDRPEYRPSRLCPVPQTGRAQPMVIAPLNSSVELSHEETYALDPKQTGQANSVYRGLREAIAVGDIPPGTLLSSTDLASGYKVTRHVVAVALRGLTRDYLVALHHLGARVVESPQLAGSPGTADARRGDTQRVRGARDATAPH